MNYEEKAHIILESLDKRINMNWNMKKLYIVAIVEGLMEIERKEEKENE